MILGISGKYESGKNTFADFLKEFLVSNGYTYTERSFAAPLKKCCELITGTAGWTEAEKALYLHQFGITVGEFLQKMGECCRDGINKEIWILAAMQPFDEDIMLITDVRYENEADFISGNNGSIIRINRDESLKSPSKRDKNHSSETSLDNYQNFYSVYQNDGTPEELKQYAHDIFYSIRPGLERLREIRNIII